MSKRDLDEHLKIDFDSSFSGVETLEAISSLPELVRNAVLVETHRDNHANPNVVAVHRLYAPLAVGDRVYTVKLTVKEFKEGVFAVELSDPLRLYHHRIEKEISPVTASVSAERSANSPMQSGDINGYTVRDVLHNVNDNDGVPFDTYYQTQQSTIDTSRAQGSTRRIGDNYVISLFQGADLSTVSHETAHVMQMEMQRLIESGLASEQLKADWEALLGADKNVPVVTDYGKLKKILQEKHKIPAETLKNLPSAMADPVMIFKSATVKGDYVMMLDLKDQNGATIVVPLSLNFETGKGYTATYIPSVYGRKSASTGKPNNVWFKNQIEAGNLVYRNNKKSRQWSTSSRLYLPWVGSRTDGKKNILTETDLVNLKNQHPEYYQLAYHGTPHRFDRFDTSQIGSGEGAQAHGWGLYFAGDRKTSERYRSELSTADT